MLGTGVNGHDSVKNAGLRVGVELNQNLRLNGGYWSAQPAKGCLTVSFWAVISLGVG